MVRGGGHSYAGLSSTTGLVLDPYFSGSKIEWLLREGGVKIARRTVAKYRDQLGVLAAELGDDRAAAGLDESALQTPPDYPVDEEEKYAFLAAGGVKAAVHSRNE